MIVSRQSTEDTIPKIVSGWAYCQCTAACTLRWEIMKLKRKCELILNAEWEKITLINSSLSFKLNFIIKCHDQEFGKPIIVCSALHLWKMICTLYHLVQTFHKQQNHWRFPLYHTMALSLVFDVCVHHALFVGYDTADVVPYNFLGASYLWSFFSSLLSQILGGVQNCPEVWKLQ